MTQCAPFKTCLSCGTKLNGKNRSKEHVIPAWLLDALDLHDEGLLQILANSEKKSIDGERKHALDSFRQGRVCRSCNGGWMSDLEVAARPIILGLIKLERGLLSLTATESLTLAGWALKTACILTSTTLVKRPLDPAYLAE